MFLWLAPARWVRAHFGHVRIVNFRQITEMPGCERSLSRCRCRGTACPGRLGCLTTASLPAVGVGLHERLSPGKPPRVLTSHPGCVEPASFERPGESEDLPGREPSAWLGSAFGITDSLRYSQTRLTLCGNRVKALALRASRGQRVARVTDAQEPSNKRTADNGPVRACGAAVLIERLKDGNASGTEKIDPT
jgi:hypothetical protein